MEFARGQIDLPSCLVIGDKREGEWVNPAVFSLGVYKCGKMYPRKNLTDRLTDKDIFQNIVIREEG